MDERGLSKRQFLWWFGVTVSLSILIPLAWVAVSTRALNSLPQPNTVGAPITAGLALVEGLIFDIALWLVSLVVLLVWGGIETRRRTRRSSRAPSHGRRAVQ